MRGSRSRRVAASSAVLALLVMVSSGCTTDPAQPPPAGGGGPTQPARTGEGTFYTLSGLGNCSYPEYPGTDIAFAAMNEVDYDRAAMCGAHVLVHGPRGSVTVKIVDRCPECRPGDIDLGKDIFPVIADPVAGRVPISWRVVSGPATPAIAYRVKEGSSQWWAAIQPLHHRNPVQRLEVQVDGAWRPLTREMHNYFVAPQGLGPGPFTVRLTDTHGQQVVSSGIVLTPGVVQPTTQQFPAR